MRSTRSNLPFRNIKANILPESEADGKADFYFIFLGRWFCFSSWAGNDITQEIMVADHPAAFHLGCRPGRARHEH
jgi:hypothetical protein